MLEMRITEITSPIEGANQMYVYVSLEMPEQAEEIRATTAYSKGSKFRQSELACYIEGGRAYQPIDSNNEHFDKINALMYKACEYCKAHSKNVPAKHVPYMDSKGNMKASLKIDESIIDLLPASQR